MGKPAIYKSYSLYKTHIIISENKHKGLIHLNHAIRTSRYNRYIPYYSAYTKPAGKTKNHNWQSLLARRIIIQSLVCILIVFFVSWLQNQDEEPAANIVSQIRIQVVEKNIEPDDIYNSIMDTYEECYQYLQGSN